MCVCAHVQHERTFHSLILIGYFFFFFWILGYSKNGWMRDGGIPILPRCLPVLCLSKHSPFFFFYFWLCPQNWLTRKRKILRVELDAYCVLLNIAGIWTWCFMTFKVFSTLLCRNKKGRKEGGSLVCFQSQLSRQCALNLWLKQARPLHYRCVYCAYNTSRRSSAVQKEEEVEEVEAQEEKVVNCIRPLLILEEKMQ